MSHKNSRSNFCCNVTSKHCSVFSLFLYTTLLEQLRPTVCCVYIRLDSSLLDDKTGCYVFRVWIQLINKNDICSLASDQMLHFFIELCSAPGPVLPTYFHFQPSLSALGCLPPRQPHTLPILKFLTGWVLWTWGQSDHMFGWDSNIWAEMTSWSCQLQSLQPH